MKLNLGCGPKNLPGFVNVDLYADYPDVRADVRALPFDDNAADEAILYHCIEHVSRADGVATLREIHRVLKPGGTLAVETPDRVKLIHLIEGSGPKTARLNVIEGTRAATGLYYPFSKPLLNGVKGALGGVSGTKEDKARWHDWLTNRWEEILAALEAGDITRVQLPDTTKPGEAHLYLWTAHELREEMEAIGFAAKIKPPQSHGERVWRDCRVEGVKR